MAYAVAEAVWLARAGVRDVYVAYPSADVAALRAVAADDELRREVTVTLDSVEHVRFLRDVLGDAVRGLGVAVDVDCLGTGGTAAPRGAPLADPHAGGGAGGGAGGSRGRVSRCAA